jgi:hypothetical protein
MDYAVFGESASTNRTCDRHHEQADRSEQRAKLDCVRVGPACTDIPAGVVVVVNPRRRAWTGSPERPPQETAIGEHGVLAL